VIGQYGSYISSFINIREERVHHHVKAELDEGLLWPDPLLQLNPSFAPGGTIADLVGAGLLHPLCTRIFSRKEPGKMPVPLTLHQHQRRAVEAAAAGDSYVLTTGTGSGKSLSYIIPIVDFVLRHGSGQGIRAIVVYPMNALANSGNWKNSWPPASRGRPLPSPSVATRARIRKSSERKSSRARLISC
jgi:ATP-dependent helicase YprA (DUF1998 family)